MIVLCSVCVPASRRKLNSAANRRCTPRCAWSHLVPHAFDDAALHPPTSGMIRLLQPPSRAFRRRRMALFLFSWHLKPQSRGVHCQPRSFGGNIGHMASCVASHGVSRYSVSSMYCSSCPHVDRSPLKSTSLTVALGFRERRTTPSPLHGLLRNASHSGPNSDAVVSRHRHSAA